PDSNAHLIARLSEPTSAARALTAAKLRRSLRVVRNNGRFAFCGRIGIFGRSDYPMLHAQKSVRALHPHTRHQGSLQPGLAPRDQTEPLSADRVAQLQA